MGETLSQLSQLFLQSIPTVIFVFLLLVLLDRFFFRPLTNVLKTREEETLGALARAREQAARADARASEYERAFQAARQDVYRMREADRRVALSEREQALRNARGQAESLVNDAEKGLEAEVEAAREELGRARQSLALEIAEAVLGDGAIAGGQGRDRL